MCVIACTSFNQILNYFVFYLLLSIYYTYYIIYISITFLSNIDIVNIFYQSETHVIDFLMMITKEQTFLIWISLIFIIFVLLCFMLFLCSMISLLIKTCKNFHLCLLRVFVIFIFTSPIYF